MNESKIEYYEKESEKFKPLEHFILRIEEMENESKYGAEVASKWAEIVNRTLKDEMYPVVHPIGQETFSLYAEFPTGVFEYALDIDGATSLIKERNIMPITFEPSKIITSVEEGNINTDLCNIKTNHKNPVMVLQSKFLTDDQPYCINGNHRIFEAYRNNQEQIEVYVFKELEFTPFFYDFLSKAIYFLEMDYNNIIKKVNYFPKDDHNAYAYFL